MQKNTRTLAAAAPAEVGIIGSTVPVVWKEETVVFVRDRVRVERTALEIAGGQNERSWGQSKMRRAQPRCPVSPPKRRIFCFEKVRACTGLIFQKLKSLAAATRAMDVHKL
jgi:hypothetical protein